ncbi:hypothetical protein DOTSEDRAFT_69939, partial [Dothistroma septosporum NZE10]
LYRIAVRWCFRRRLLLLQHLPALFRHGYLYWQCCYTNCCWAERPQLTHRAVQLPRPCRCLCSIKNQRRVSELTPTLDRRKYGLDFSECLTGELVTVHRPRAVARPKPFGDTWVVGDWRTTGDNNRGGLTARDRDANPEAILIGSPLDGTLNPNVTT